MGVGWCIMTASRSPVRSSQPPGPPLPSPPLSLRATTLRNTIHHSCGVYLLTELRGTRDARARAQGVRTNRRPRVTPSTTTTRPLSALGENRVRRLLQDAALAALLGGLALEQDVSLGTPLRAPGVLDLQRWWKRSWRRGKECVPFRSRCGVGPERNTIKT